MKKITLILAAFIAVTFASCNKAKTCTCTTTQTFNNVAYGSTQTDVTSMDKVSKGDANVACPKTQNQTQVVTGGGAGTYVTTKTCVLS